MGKLAIYTCITGGYDPLQQPLTPPPGLSFICYVGPGEKKRERDGVWEIRELPGQPAHPILAAREVKIRPHLFLPEYDHSLWMDGNLRIADAAFYDLLRETMERGALYCGVSHPKRDCIYDEIDTCRAIGYISPFTQIRLWTRLYLDGFPRHAGLFESNLLLRAHHEARVLRADELWWKMLNRYGKRDQMSLMYCLRRAGLETDYLLPKGTNARNTPLIQYTPHQHAKASDFR